ncbi:hypothetical protein L1987_54987 [Smallanthus sonchifolius]|uniref:Uncharacterized protein n=1 Tax=Smallanthus sonchifolius TaxID=185202 RepID=A0ACB9E8N9_9ASTR|nr:hypothetical protein L1987_54987 [Smallanthus sonchifolius]
MDQSHQLLTQPENQPPLDDHPMVDSTRPFRSVKEAISIFGERLQTSETNSPPPKPPFTLPKQEAPIWNKSTPNYSNQPLWKSPETDHEPSTVVMNTLKQLELEVKETKRELKMLKERESETEVALACLKAELHKNMSKVAKAEAEAAGKEVVVRSSMTMRQVLSGIGGEKDRKYLSDKKVLKKKPVVPLVTDLFAWKIRKA